MPSQTPKAVRRRADVNMQPPGTVHSLCTKRLVADAHPNKSQTQHPHATEPVYDDTHASHPFKLETPAFVEYCL